jgi:hypothetical protein
VYQFARNQVNGPLLASYPFTAVNTSFPATITATGWDHRGYPSSADTSVPMYMKLPASNVCERGVGISGITSNEIDIRKHYVQLDFTNIDQYQCTQVALSIGSTQPGEGYEVYGSYTAGTLGTLLYSSTYNTNCPQQYTYKGNTKYSFYSVTASDNSAGNVTPKPLANVLIQSVSLQCGCNPAPSVTPSISVAPSLAPSAKPTTVPSSYFKPSKASVTSKPSKAPVTNNPSKAPVTSKPSKSPVTSKPSKAPVPVYFKSSLR